MSGRAPSAHVAFEIDGVQKGGSRWGRHIGRQHRSRNQLPRRHRPAARFFLSEGGFRQRGPLALSGEGGRASPAALDRREKIRQVTNPVERSDPLQPKVNPWLLHRSNPQVSDANAEAGSMPLRLAGSSDLKPPGSGRDSVTAVLAQTRPALHPHCDRPRFSIRRRLFSGPATDEYEAALSRPPVCPVAVRLSETPRPK